MGLRRLQITAILLLAGLGALFSPAYSESVTFGFRANAKMMHEHDVPVNNAYGLINVVIDGDGRGRMEVMFSNGSHIDWVKFNAEVRFIDAAGMVVEEQYVYRWLESADVEGASERKVSKTLSLNSVKSVEVDFYLSDIIDIEDKEVIAGNSVYAYF